MKTCETCGEEIAPQSSICPYCESLQAWSPPTTNGPAIKTINLEAGLPTVEEALRRLAAQLDRARLEGVRVVRLIHGWGSAAGGGGRIRAAVRQWLQQEAEARRIHFFLPGDHFTNTTPRGRDFLSRHPALRQSIRTDRENPGITFVEP